MDGFEIGKVFTYTATSNDWPIRITVTAADEHQAYQVFEAKLQIIYNLRVTDLDTGSLQTYTEGHP